MTYARLALALELKYEEVSNRTMAKARPLMDFFMNLDDLYNAGFISLEEIANTWGRGILIWGALLTPVVERQRA